MNIRPALAGLSSVLLAIGVVVSIDAQIYSPPPTAQPLTVSTPNTPTLMAPAPATISASPVVISPLGGPLTLTIHSPASTPCELVTSFPTPPVLGAPTRFECAKGITSVSLTVPVSGAFVTQYSFELLWGDPATAAFVVVPVVGTLPRAVTTSALTPPILTNHTIAPPESSGNWAGYEVKSFNSEKIGAVTGQWAVPSVRCIGAHSTYASQWIGIDGAGSSTVEQLGTATNCQNGHASYSAWYAMFGNTTMGGNNIRPLSPTAYPVAPGDLMSGKVLAPLPASNSPWELQLTDSTRGWTSTTELYQTQGQIDQYSAEWIVERPAECVRFNVCPPSALANFSPMSFTRASAYLAGSAVPIAPIYFAPVSMIVNNHEGANTLTISPSPLRAGGTAFTLRYPAPSY